MLDGGLATEMEKHGADLDDELWSAKMLFESPGLVRRIHLDYLEAGADIIATASYQASIEGFGRAGFGQDEARRLMHRSVELAAEARDAFWANSRHRKNRCLPLVAASIGPYGACLHDGSEYHGNYGVDRQHLLDFHRARMEVLADTEADLFAFETIPSLMEAEVLLEVLREFPDKWAWISFSCRDGSQVSHGETLLSCALQADNEDQVLAIGVNCTAPELLPELLESLSGISTPLLVYPNSGEKWHSAGNEWSGPTCESFPVWDWYVRGARLLGGCCRTSLATIQQMRSDLAQHLNHCGIHD